jgi:hypothetical protein
MERPALAGSGEAIFGAMAGMAIGAMIAGGANRQAVQPRQGRQPKRTAARRSKPPAAPAAAAGARDPFAGAGTTVPAKYQ